MKRVVLTLAGTIFVCQLALAVEKKAYKDMTPEEKSAWIAERKARSQVILEKKTGGMVRKANSANGYFVIINGQKSVDEKDLLPIISTLDSCLKVQSSIHSTGTDVGVSNVKNQIKAANGTLGVALVENDIAPAFLAAPEEGWVVVNVRPLVKGVSKEVAASRVRKEALRAYGFVAGGIYLGRGAMLMREIQQPSDLDTIPREMFCIDLKAHLSESSARFGITPWYQTTYRKACEQGWAPAPTNDYQKAIWDEVHAIPQKPIKIEYNEKRDKGK